MSRINSIENDLIVLTKQTIYECLKSDCPAELMSLYTFYYYIAKLKEECTTGDVAKCLKWSEKKVLKIQKLLLEFGLIEYVQEKDDDGKIVDNYIKINEI